MSPRLSNFFIFIGGIASVAIILGFFGVDAGSFRKAVPDMSTHFIWLIALIVSLSTVGVGLYQRLKHPRVTTKNVESKVREWVDSFGWSTKKVSDPSWYFGFEIRLKNDIPLALVRLKEYGQYLTLAAKVETGPIHKPLFEKLSKADQEEFSRELRLELARAKIGSGVKLPNEVTIEKLIPITDSLTEASLIDAIQEVQFAVVLVSVTITLGIERRQKAV
jgi:hypothetical protein